LRDAGLIPSEPVVSLAPAQVREETAQRRFRDAPSNEWILHEYADAPGIQRKTKTAYVGSVREFERVISPKSFLDASTEDARAFERRCLDACGHLRSTVFGEGGKATTTPRFTCNAGLFQLLGAPPPSCSRACPAWVKQKTGPLARLKALKHFYEFLTERRLVTENPFTRVAKARGKVRTNRTEPRKYAPSPGEVRELLAAARLVATPLEQAVVLAFAKWGRRPAHTLDLGAGELVGVATPSEQGAFADFSGVKERFESRAGDGATKLLGYLTSPIDNEFLSFLRGTYLPWRQERHGYAWNEGPLFPGHRRGGVLHEDVVANMLDHLMLALTRMGSEADRARWQAHLDRGSRTRITPGTFRHTFTTTLKKLGVEDGDIDILRGDVPRGTRYAYMHLDRADILRMYQFPELLS
jgi:hypothetical protein